MSAAVTVPFTIAASSATVKLAACATGASLLPLMVTTSVDVVPSVERTVKLSVSVWPTPRA